MVFSYLEINSILSTIAKHHAVLLDIYSYIKAPAKLYNSIHLTNKIPFLDVYGDINLVGHVIM